MIRFATEEDVPAILALVQELAEFEKASGRVIATEESLREVLFESKTVFAHVAEVDGQIVGVAIWFLNFSTWLGRHGVYLEDLYVKPEFRGEGLGKSLLLEIVRVANERGYGRVEWSVLDWNTPAIDFYKALGAESMDEWTTFRLEGEALARAGQQ